MKPDTPNRRASLREEINRTSRDAFILKEMKRIGIWPKDKEKPSLQEDLIKRKTELQQEIRELSKKNNRYKNREVELNKLRKEKLRKSKEQQKLNKLQKQEEREEKKKTRRAAEGKDITYLGKRYSRILKESKCDLSLLSKHDLGHITDVSTLAAALKVSVYTLRFLSFDRKLTKHSHYVSYGIKKKSGGVRKISAPKPKLKAVQRAILDNILYALMSSEHSHGFAKNRSIVTNARPHIGSDIIVNMDLKDFFPTIDYPRVYGLYQKIGFSSQISTILALICTIPDSDKVKVHGELWHLNSDKRFLPQGAATSPMITNLICRKMDSRLAGIAKKLNFTYTRYADDMTFSGPASSRSDINKLKWQVKSVVKDEDFKLHPDKTQIMVTGHRKEVTGIVVNEKLNISRKKLKAFRALLHQVELDGLQGKSWGDPNVDLLSSMEGYARYIHMVNPKKGKFFVDKVKVISRKYKPKAKKSIFGEISKVIRKVFIKKTKK